MDFRPIQPNVVRYEMRVAKGEDPFTKHQKKPGGFGRFLSGLGRVLGAIAAPLSFIFPPAMIGALGAYGVGAIGDQIQASAYKKQMQEQGTHQAANVSFPGMEDVFSSPQAAAISPVQADIMNVLYARNDLMMESAHAMESKSI